MACSRCKKDALHPVALVQEKGRPDFCPGEERVWLACFTCMRYFFIQPWWA